MIAQILQPTLYAASLNRNRFTQSQIVKEAQSEIQPENDVSSNLAEAAVENSFKPIAVNHRSQSMKVLSAGGPGQAESSGFSLTSTDGMVDKFTGDFSYSIPLADVEGYPIVLSYNSAVSMGTEASWVGLGWDLNVGAVSRELRGLPDEFNGSQTVVRTYNQNDNTDTGSKFGAFAGLKYQSAVETGKFDFALQAQITALLGKYDDNYIGKGRTFDFGLQSSPSLVVADDYSFGPSFGFGYNSDSKRGIGRTSNIGLEAGYAKTTIDSDGLGFSISSEKSYNSRRGLASKTSSFGLNGNLTGDNAGVGGSYGSSSTVMYGTQTAVPSISIRNRSTSVSDGVRASFSQKVGGSNLYWTIGVITQLQSRNTTVVLNAYNQIFQPAIGYFHNGKYRNFSVKEFQYPIMDFNRTNDEEYSEDMKNLAFSVQTYDIFRVNALGLGATFRGRRNDFGTYQDPNKSNDMTVEGVNLTGGFTSATPTNSISIGLSGTLGSSNTETGLLKQESGGYALDFTYEPVNYTFDQAVYFKGVGEMTPEDMTDELALGGSMKSRFGVKRTSDFKDIVLSDQLYHDNGTAGPINPVTINQPENVVRATSYRPYTAKEYTTIFGLSKYNSYYSYALNSIPTSVSSTTISRLQTTTANNPNYENHISAVEVVNTDGMKYIFGIPAYDLNSAQVAFCATGLNSSTNTVTYTTGDNTVTNPRGVSGYFDKTVMPAVAHSFLLTELQSSDYIDRLNDGPTLDDIGSYYKFNYTRLYSKDNPYRWRMPVEANSAYFAEGKLATHADDMANYAYGEKEIWYTNSVESKNIIAEFVLNGDSDPVRLDACGVAGENGGLSPSDNRLKYLKKIVIYNRSERMDPSTGASAIPLQVIEFEYSYELCQNTPTNTSSTTGQKGKLTLKSIRSYSGKSEEMGLYAYKFEYESTENPDFTYNTDAWGNPRISGTAMDKKAVTRFPYADQTPVSAERVAKMWKLKKITNPTGGTLEISYEPDSYATVQDSRAMKHMDVAGFTNVYRLLNIKAGSTWNGSTGMSSNFHENLAGAITGTSGDIMMNYYYSIANIDVSMTPNNVVLFKLEKTIPVSDAAPNQTLKELYFSENEGQKLPLTELLLKLHVKVKGIDPKNELIDVFGLIEEGYVDDLPSIGVMPKVGSDTFYSYGYVILKPGKVETNDNKDRGTVFNSLELAAIEYIRRELPDLVYGTCADCPTTMEIDKGLKREGDVNLVMHDLGWANSIVTDADTLLTTMRLYVPGNLKYGGNGRVKQLTYTDNWNGISTENTGVYTWNYLYPWRSGTSGNAASEPTAVLDECEFYKWETYVNRLEHFPDDHKYTVVPVSAILLPAPIIGYEEVVVEINGVQNKGYSKTEYYTTHQFPMVTGKTALARGIDIDEPTSVLLGKSTEKFGFSQGFVVETNDFHGKLKRQTIVNYQEDNGNVNQVVQSRTTYNYAGLKDTHKAVKRDGTVVDAYLAQETDVHVDSRYVESTSLHQQFGMSLKVILSSPPLPIFLPSYSHTETVQGFYSAATVKHINRSAIVESVVTENLGSVNTAQNELYDYQTGNILLSSLNDEYNDRLYSFSYPAHWYYKVLREYAESQGTTVSVTLNSNNTFSNADDVITEGDYVQLMDITGTPKAWVARHNVTNQLYLMTEGGTITTHTISTGTHSVKILQTNRANRQGEMMQSVITKHNPWSGSAIVMPVAEIISASAMTYQNRNSLKCGRPHEKEEPYNNNEVSQGSTVNPYLMGTRGDLVPDLQYSWQSERLNALHDYKTRFDGTYTSYVPFYQIPSIGSSSGWFQVNQSGHPNYTSTTNFYYWRKSGTVTAYDPYGAPLESKDQINVKAAVLYGYNNMFNLAPVAQAMNARQQDIGFDGFEDYSYYNYLINESSGGTHPTAGIITTNSHFDFKETDQAVEDASIDNTVRHSGLSSLKIVNSASVSNSYDVAPSNCTTEPADRILPNLGFIAEECYCVPPFAPDTVKYVIGGWIKASSPTVSDGQIVVSITGSTPQTLTFTPSGNMLDGWRRVEGVFTILPGSTGISVKLEHINGAAAYFDDIRIHPFTAGMTTTVYDPKTMLPMASHDGYNFTTFYNYDENLNLVRMRVETIEGIKTVSESEMSGFKQPKP
jgi:hypothetical protein